jgi:alpha-glucosidase (family GH31 glycosyl hydrolase)
LKWYYSVFVRNYENAIGAGAGTVMKPIWWLNPEDQLAYTFENNEFLVGDEFLIIPVLIKGDDLK